MLRDTARGFAAMRMHPGKAPCLRLVAVHRKNTTLGCNGGHAPARATADAAFSSHPNPLDPPNGS